MAVIRGRTSGVHQRGYIEGGPQLVAALAKLRASLSSAHLVAAVSAGAEVIAEEWRSNVRSRIGLGPGTAHYVDAIGFRASPGDNGATAFVGLPNNVSVSPGEAHPREYAARLEFGGSGRAAQPTLRPAFDTARRRAVDAEAAVLRRLLGQG